MNGLLDAVVHGALADRQDGIINSAFAIITLLFFAGWRQDAQIWRASTWSS